MEVGAIRVKIAVQSGEKGALINFTPTVSSILADRLGSYCRQITQVLQIKWIYEKAFTVHCL